MTGPWLVLAVMAVAATFSLIWRTGLRRLLRPVDRRRQIHRPR
ncbi:MAG: hypothetical protein ACRDTA_26120 [Pseudonocardiaceae bacterium]